MARKSIVKHSRLEEREWIIENFELLLREDLQTTIESPAFIFELPYLIRDDNPNAYIPCRIALGPYHHLRPELYQFQYYKLQMAKAAKEELQLAEFHQLVDQLKPLELRIRACFGNHLDIRNETLAWIMLVDALFLIQLLLSIFFEKMRRGNQCVLRQPLMLPLLNFNDQNLYHGEDETVVAQFQILSDVLKLENQIPFLVIKGILPTYLTAKLPLFLYHFCRSVSPFFLLDEYTNRDLPAIFDQSHHLLHFLYFSILILPHYVFELDQRLFIMAISSCRISFFQKWLRVLGSVLNSVFIQQLSEAIGLIWDLLELLWMVKSQSSSSTSQHPLIPSASQLQKLHVNFKPNTCNGIVGTRFIESTSPTLFLPVITVNAFTETMFGNLVAFEAMANINPPVLARYLELMNALIVTPKDLKILKDVKIIESQLESDEEVVKIFKGVGSSISALKNNKTSLEKLNHLRRPNGSTSKSKLEAKKGILKKIKDGYEQGLKGMVDEINQYYNSSWRVKTKRFVKKYSYSVLKTVAILVIISLIILVLVRLVIGSLQPFG